MPPVHILSIISKNVVTVDLNKAAVRFSRYIPIQVCPLLILDRLVFGQAQLCARLYTCKNSRWPSGLFLIGLPSVFVPLLLIALFLFFSLLPVPCPSSSLTCLQIRYPLPVFLPLLEFWNIG